MKCSDTEFGNLISLVWNKYYDQQKEIAHCQDISIKSESKYILGQVQRSSKSHVSIHQSTKHT